MKRGESSRTKSKTTQTFEDKKTSHKERIRQIIKKPKEKFLTKSQEDYWNVLGDNQITLCFGPAGVGKSYIAMKRAVDLLCDENNKYEKIIKCFNGPNTTEEKISYISKLIGD